MKKTLFKKVICSITLLPVAASAFGLSFSLQESYPVGRAITNKVEIYRAAYAVMEGYNNHVRQIKQENKQMEITKSFAAISAAGVLNIPFRFPVNKQEKEMRDHLFKISSYLVGNQNTYSKIRPDAAFCVLQNALYLYPSVKFQKMELDETRQEKVLYRSMRMCPGKMRKWR